MEYIAIINQEESNKFGVVFPDFEGCVSVGDTLEEAKTMAKEALELHIEGLLADGETLPQPKSLEDIKKDYNFTESFIVKYERV